jgi:hypothetical protein
MENTTVRANGGFGEFSLGYVESEISVRLQTLGRYAIYDSGV